MHGTDHIAAIRNGWENPPEDGYEARKSRVVQAHMAELDTVMDYLGDLSGACENNDLHDPFASAMICIREWVRGVVPNYR